MEIEIRYCIDILLFWLFILCCCLEDMMLLFFDIELKFCKYVLKIILLCYFI